MVCTRLLCLVFAGFEFGEFSLFCDIYCSAMFLWVLVCFMLVLNLYLVEYTRDLWSLCIWFPFDFMI